MRKVTVELKVKILIHADEGKEISEVMDEMNYEFTYDQPGADIMDSEIIDYEVLDSR